MYRGERIDSYRCDVVEALPYRLKNCAGRHDDSNALPHHHVAQMACLPMEPSVNEASHGSGHEADHPQESFGG
jgi:hypothetical protein